MFSKLALGAIWGYQQYVSPRKGFRCAYSVQHGGTGCSGYAKYAIRDHGLWSAIPIIRRRLRDCRAAYMDMRATCPVHSKPLDEDKREELARRRKTDRWYNKRDCCMGSACECATILPGVCGGGAARTGAAKTCDINPCDGDIGIGGCDCASCDCGGCSCG